MRSCTAARWRATVASSPRAIGPGQRGPGAEPDPVLDRGAHQRREQLAVDPGGGRQPLGRALERREEVRRDRGRRVVGGAVLVGDRHGAHAEPRGELARRSRARAASSRRPPPRRRRIPSRRRAATVISGCSPNASWPASASSVVAPEQWPTGTRGVSAAAAAAIWSSGTQSSTASTPSGSAPRPSGPSIARPVARSADASAVPSRPAPTIAQLRQRAGCSGAAGRGEGGDPVQFSHEIPAGLDRGYPPQTPASPRRRPAAAASYLERVATAETRREELKAVWQQAQACTKCPQLAATRNTVVFGAGNADADLMFVGEAPGANEDKQGLPFVGQAGRLLDKLLDEIGLARADVFIANTLMCRPPGNRDPLPGEIDACQDWLFKKLELIEPRVVCTLGQLLDQAAARRSGDRHHAAARARGDPPHRTADGAAVPALPPGRGALHAVDARGAASDFAPHPRAARPAGARPARAGGAGARRARARGRRRAGRGAAAREPEPSQLGLF